MSEGYVPVGATEVEWARTLIPRGEELCVYWSLSDDVLSHLGHASSRIFAEIGASGPIDIKTLATAHGRGMIDRNRSTGIPYNGENLAWAHRIIDPVNRILDIWGPYIEQLDGPEANVRLTSAEGLIVEPDIVHATGIVELKNHLRSKKARRRAKDQVLAHAMAARDEGLDVKDIEVWSLLDGRLDRGRFR